MPHSIRPTVLIIDGHSGHRQALRQLLGGRNIDILEAATAQQANIAALMRPVALVLMDANLSDLDTHEAIALLRSEPAMADVPIVLLGADDLVPTAAPQADDVVPLPIDPVDLSIKVDGFLQVYEACRQAAAQHEPRAWQAARSPRSGESRRRRVSHDALTGLPNRLLFDDCLERLLSSQARTAIAAVIIEVAGVDAPHELLGGRISDDLIRTLAQRIDDAGMRIHTLARIAKRRFGLILDGEAVSDNFEASLHSLHREIARPVHLLIGGSEAAAGYQPRLRIGWALAASQACGAAELVCRAEAAVLSLRKRGQLGVADDTILG